MLAYPHIDPVLIAIGPVAVRWYGVMFLVALGGAYGLARRRAARPGSTWTPGDVDDLVFHGAVGAILGGRLGWVLFYGLEYEVTDPLRVLRVWEGGMSFHGGLIGVVVALVLFAYRKGRRVGDVFDFAAPLPAVGLFSVRVANFINGELWGKPTQVPWAFVYQGVPRHASQLYEATLEGIVLGTAVWVFTARPPRVWPDTLCHRVRTPAGRESRLSALRVGDRGPAPFHADDHRRHYTSWRRVSTPAAGRQRASGSRPLTVSP